MAVRVEVGIPPPSALPAGQSHVSGENTCSPTNPQRPCQVPFFFMLVTATPRRTFMMSQHETFYAVFIKEATVTPMARAYIHTA